MSSKNSASLIGRLGKDPESRTFTSGGSVTNFSLATSERWKDKQSGETKEATQWHNCVAYGRLGEIVAQYARKGSLVDVEGSITYRKYNDTNGVEKWVTEIRCKEVILLDKVSDSQSGNGQRQAQPAANQRQTASAPQDNWDSGQEFPE